MKILERLDELRAKATPGPYSCLNGWGEVGGHIKCERIGPQGQWGGIQGGPDMYGPKADFERIVLACNAEEALVRVARAADGILPMPYTIAKRAAAFDELLEALDALRDLDGGEA